LKFTTALTAVVTAGDASYRVVLLGQGRCEGYLSLRITTGAQNDAMRALAASSAPTDVPSRLNQPARRPLTQQDDTVNWRRPRFTTAVNAVVNFNRAYWKMLMNMTGWGSGA